MVADPRKNRSRGWVPLGRDNKWFAIILISRNAAKPENVGDIKGVTFASDAMGMPVSRRSSRNRNEFTSLRMSMNGSIGGCYVK